MDVTHHGVLVTMVAILNSICTQPLAVVVAPVLLDQMVMAVVG